MVRKETIASEAIPKKFPITKGIWVSIGKNKMQLLFFVIFLLIFPFLALFLSEFNTIFMMRRNQRPDYNWPKYSDLLIAFGFSMFFTGLLIICLKVFKNTFANFVSQRYQGDERIERAERRLNACIRLATLPLL